MEEQCIRSFMIIILLSHNLHAFRWAIFGKALKLTKHIAKKLDEMKVSLSFIAVYVRPSECIDLKFK